MIGPRNPKHTWYTEDIPGAFWHYPIRGTAGSRRKGHALSGTARPFAALEAVESGEVWRGEVFCRMDPDLHKKHALTGRGWEEIPKQHSRIKLWNCENGTSSFIHCASSSAPEESPSLQLRCNYVARSGWEFKNPR